jgi:eukaryotic-like serine/threonine-protein kinase
MDAQRCSSCEQDTSAAGTVGGLCAVCLLTTARRNDYTIINVLGHGPSGTTYLAERSATRRIVVLKVGNSCADAQSIVESVRKAAGELDAATVTCAVDAGVIHDRWPYVVRAYVRGVPITTFCRQRRADRDLTRTLLATVREVVARAHTRGIVHGNLAPSNVFASDGDQGPIVTVSDFGMRLGSADEDTAALDRLRVALR